MASPQLIQRFESATPHGRDRAVDALRALAILGVVLGHWLVTALVVGDDGSLRVASPLKHLPQLLYGQLYFLIVYRRPGASLAGYLSLVRCIPHIVRERRRLRAARRIDIVELDRLLTIRMREPPLRVLLRRRLRGARL